MRCSTSCARSSLRLQGITTFFLPPLDSSAEEFCFFKAGALTPFFNLANSCWPVPPFFFAYESVRLRGVATEQARRSAYFDDEPAPEREESGPGGLRGGWDDDYDRFDEPQPVQRRFGGRNAGMDNRPEDDFYRPRRTSRAAIPEEAASRRGRGRDQDSQDWDQTDERSRRMARFRAGESKDERRPDFGERRSDREDQRRGSRPTGRQERPRDLLYVPRPRKPPSAPVGVGEIQHQQRHRKAKAFPLIQPEREGGRPQAAPSVAGPDPIPHSVTAPTSQVQSNPETGRPAPRKLSSRNNSPRSNSPRARDNSSRFDD